MTQAITVAQGRGVASYFSTVRPVRHHVSVCAPINSQPTGLHKIAAVQNRLGPSGWQGNGQLEPLAVTKDLELKCFVGLIDRRDSPALRLLPDEGAAPQEARDHGCGPQYMGHRTTRPRSCSHGRISETFSMYKSSTCRYRPYPSVSK
jgi:hypothetical protein